MSRRTPRNRSPAFKAMVASAVIKGEKTSAGSAQVHDVHPKQITAWKSQLAERAASSFGWDSSHKPSEREVDLKTLHATNGGLTLENDFFIGCARKA